jgi:hypothetical protein
MDAWHRESGAGICDIRDTIREITEQKITVCRI